MSDVRCCDCNERVPLADTHVVKANNASGRDVRCNPCGEAASRRITEFNVTRCQDCRHGRDRHDPNVPGCIECQCREFLPSQALELWEMAQQMREDPTFDPGWPFADLIRERGWAS